MVSAFCIPAWDLDLKQEDPVAQVQPAIAMTAKLYLAS